MRICRFISYGAVDKIGYGNSFNNLETTPNVRWHLNLKADLTWTWLMQVFQIVLVLPEAADLTQQCNPFVYLVIDIIFNLDISIWWIHFCHQCFVNLHLDA